MEVPRRLYYDTLSHSPSALRYLIQQVGADRLLLGTDLPFDMGDLHQVREVEALDLGPEATRQILGGTAAVLGLAGWTEIEPGGVACR
jgi:aminocarboxymuconate-semialdehyde decarboxylase